MLKSLFPWKHHKTKAMAAQQTMEVVVPEDPSFDQPLLPCHVCGRTFLPAPLRKHERICEKSTVKKRKPFDSLRQRVEGTDLADFHQKSYLKKIEPKSTPEPKRNKRASNWKEKHLELVNTIRAAKGIPSNTDAPSPKGKSTSSLMAGNERCPSCDRQFGPKAYDRHVEWCKEKKAQQRIHHSPADVLLAKERLEARIKYVPPLNKSKKVAVRDKYCNNNTSTSTETLASSKNMSPLSRGPSVRKPRSEVNVLRGIDKLSNGTEKARLDGTGVERVESSGDKHTPLIGQASKADIGKNSQKKKGTPFTKINKTNMNQADGISVASLKFDYAAKKMVTWKDTIGDATVDDKSDNVNTAKHSDSDANSIQSANAVVGDARKINCDKILSSSDVLHKVARIPLCKQGFSKQICHKDKKGISREEKRFLPKLVGPLPKNQICKDINSKKFNKASIHDEPSDSGATESLRLEPFVPLSKKRFAKKINETRKKFVVAEESTINIVSSSSEDRVAEDPYPDKFFKKLNKADHKKPANSSRDSEEILSDSQNPTLKSSFTKSLNNNSKSDEFDSVERNPIDDLGVTSRDSENSLVSNCSTEETYLLNNNSSGEFNFTQNSLDKDDLSNMALPEDDFPNAKTSSVKNTVFEKSDEKYLGLDGNYRRLDTIIGSESSLTVKSSDLKVNYSKASCLSVTEALEKLTIDSNEELEQGKDSPDQKPEYSSQPLEIDSCRNTHKEISNWFDEYMKKADGDDDENNAECFTEAREEASENEERNKSDNVVVLFKSTTELDLMKYSVDRTGEKDQLSCKVSQDSIMNSSCDLDSFDLENRKSDFSLKRSVSNIDITASGSLAVSSKGTLVSIYKSKNNFDSDSLGEYGRMKASSLPNIYILTVCKKYQADDNVEGDNSVDGDVENCRKDDDGPSSLKETKKNVVDKSVVLDERENLRRKILELAAEEFLEEYHHKEIEKPNLSCNPLDEEYTVPKKKRKVDGCTGRNAESENDARNFAFTNLDFDLENFKTLTISPDASTDDKVVDENAMGDFLKKDVPYNNIDTNGTKSSANRSSKMSSARTVTSIDCSPRLVTILDKVFAKSGSSDDGKALVVVTLSDCMRLVEMDKTKLPKIRRQLEKLRIRHRRRHGSDVKLPDIENCEKEEKESKEENVPEIRDGRFIRRENAKKCKVDVKTGVKDVYLEYDSKSGNIIYDPFESAQRQFMELLECDDFKSLTPSNNISRPHTTTGVSQAKKASPAAKKKTIKSAEPLLTRVEKNNHRASVIEPPNTFKDSLDSVNDDFELIENLINDQFTDDNKNSNSFYLHSKPQKESLTLGDILDNRKYSDDMSSSSIDPRLINENDDLSIPEHFKIDDFSPTSTTDTDMTLQNDVDHYSLQYDKKIAALEPKVEKISPPPAERKPLVKRSVSLLNRSKTDQDSVKVTSKKLTNKSKLTSRSVSSVSATKNVSVDKKKGLAGLKKTTALFEPLQKPPSLKNKNDVDNYFSEKQQRNSRSSPEKEVCESVEDALKPEDLFAVDDEMYEEYKKYEEMYLKEKAQQSGKKRNKPKMIDINFGILTASEEEDQGTAFNNKISNDSAYGSLTRKTAKHRSKTPKLTPLEQKPADSTSSSGSDNCPASPSLAKFCHECGNKYPLTTAKFCIECGIKRLVL